MLKYNQRLKTKGIIYMKKILALLLIIAVVSLCMFSCRGNSGGENNDQGGENGGKTDDDEITDITEEDPDVLLNEDNIDPNGWTTID